MELVYDAVHERPRGAQADRRKGERMWKIWLFLHVLGVVVWVGGMFFAYMALRPAAAQLLDAPQRLGLWRGTLSRFFLWVWLSVALILVSGLALVGVSGGWALARWHVHTMFALGLVMMALFAHIYFVPFRRLRHAVAAADWASAAPALAQIRRIVGTNLLLGLLVMAVALLGRPG